jgi:hypothetical protein
MPNWNEATFEVVGDKEIIDVILKTGFDFDKIRPEPEDIMEQPDVPSHVLEGATSPAWYEWRIKNWGTKWKPTAENNHLNVERISDIKLKVNMTTAWCLPIEILKFITMRYPIQITGTTQEETEEITTSFIVDKGVIKGGV